MQIESLSFRIRLYTNTNIMYLYDIANNYRNYMATPCKQPYSQWHTENIHIPCTSIHFMQGVSSRVCVFSENYAIFTVSHYMYIYERRSGEHFCFSSAEVSFMYFRRGTVSQLLLLCGFDFFHLVDTG